jgi:hypothetical protein
MPPALIIAVIGFGQQQVSAALAAAGQCMQGMLPVLVGGLS